MPFSSLPVRPDKSASAPAELAVSPPWAMRVGAAWAMEALNAPATTVASNERICMNGIPADRTMMRGAPVVRASGPPWGLMMTILLRPRCGSESRQAVRRR